MRLLPVQFCHVSFFFIPVSPSVYLSTFFLKTLYPYSAVNVTLSQTSDRIMAVLVLMPEVAYRQTGIRQTVPCY
jgi:hypothetical protein